MPEAYKAVFKIGDDQVTSLVMDESEFNALCEEFIGLFPQ